MAVLRQGEKPSIRERIAALQVLTPPQVDEKLLALGYRGQAHARKAASVMAYRHIRRLQRIVIDGVSLTQLGARENYLFIGPTGCGKTHLVELLFRDILAVPTVTVDITQYSETGYIGEDVTMILARLFEAADGDLLWAACGVVCIDEFDKLASSRSNARFAGEGTTKDVSGFGVQRGLLTLLAGNEAQFPADFGYAQLAPKLTLPLAGVTFVACGAFSGLKSTADAMSAIERIGFGRGGDKLDPEAIAVKLDADVLEHTAAFAKYGFLPELIGRFTRVVGFAPLDEITLAEILRDNVIANYTAEFASEGLGLTIDASVIELVVKRALKRELGARGLRMALVPSLEDAAYRYFGQGAEREVKLVVRDGAIVIE
jgi:ATP-dependent Clp protease ATP-binding subunit ClpX